MEKKRLVRWVARFFHFLAGIELAGVVVWLVCLGLFLSVLVTGYGYGMVTDILGDEIRLAYRPALIVAALTLFMVSGLIARRAWNILAHVVRHMGEGTLATATCLLKMEKLPRLFLICYLLNVVLSFGEGIMSSAFPHLLASGGARAYNYSAFGAAVDLTIPNFHGSIALVLAIFSWLAVKLMRQTQDLVHTVETLQEEANLTV